MSVTVKFVDISQKLYPYKHVMIVVTLVTFGLIIYNAYPAFEGKEMRYGVWPMFFIYPLLWLAGLVEITKYFRHYDLNKMPTLKDNYVILFFSIWFLFLIVVPFFAVFVLVLALNDT